jgi:hypothetical protein
MKQMTGSFAQRADHPYIQVRDELLENSLVLAPPDIPSTEPVTWSQEVAAALLREVQCDGLGIVTLSEPLCDDDFIALGKRLGVIGAETDPAVQPYVDRGVILNLTSGLPRTADVSLQPFSAAPLTLHSEGSGRPLAQQPRYIVLMCCEPGDAAAAAQTVLVPMAAVAHEIGEAAFRILEHTRYYGRRGVPTVARRVDSRPVFSFRDFQYDPLDWQCDATGLVQADVNDAFCSLLTAIYSPGLATGLTWKRGRLAVVDNTFFFHGRTAGRFGPSARRHLRRLRILARQQEPAADGNT